MAIGINLKRATILVTPSEYTDDAWTVGIYNRDEEHSEHVALFEDMLAASVCDLIAAIPHRDYAASTTMSHFGDVPFRFTPEEAAAALRPPITGSHGPGRFNPEP